MIAPDGHVPSALPGFDKATPYFMISPDMGANLTQLLIVFETDGSARFSKTDQQRFFYVEEGQVSIERADQKTEFGVGGYLYSGGEALILNSNNDARVTLFEAPHEKLDDSESNGLEIFAGNVTEVSGEPFLGNERALLQTLLPDELARDMAVNIFTYEPGATLPFVETHIMEHGLLMLAGQGIYRLEENYYAVAKGDVIWMAPYCPQWFVAMGDEPASYLYYKNLNRHPQEKAR